PRRAERALGPRAARAGGLRGPGVPHRALGPRPGPGGPARGRHRHRGLVDPGRPVPATGGGAAPGVPAYASLDRPPPRSAGQRPRTAAVPGLPRAAAAGARRDLLGAGDARRRLRGGSPGAEAGRADRRAPPAPQVPDPELRRKLTPTY